MVGDQLENEFESAQHLGEDALDRLVGEPGQHVDSDALQQLLKDHPELSELYERLNDPVQLKSILDASRRSGKYKAEDLQLLLSKIRPVPQQEPVRRSLTRTIYYMTAAAAILLVVIGAGWLYNHSRSGHKSEQLTIAASSPDIAPGGNKAVLTLANGRQIVLDSVANGLLANQGEVHVVKSGQGQLDYKVSSTGHSETAYNSITTPFGGTFALTLADGTKVWLNAGSTLRYPVSFAGAKDRKVELTGEAYFEVAANKDLPFHVSAGRSDIKVIGTHFNVMAYPDENDLETTLLQGAVAVSQGDETKLIHPGQQVRVSHEGVLSLANVRADDYVAWKNGLIELHHEELARVMRSIGRWYDIQIAYDGRTFPSRTFSGTVPRTLTLLEVLKVLQLDGIQARLNGRKLTILLK